MATKISELTTATTLDGSELIPVVQGGVTKQTSVTDLVSGGELPAYSTSETLTTRRWTDGKPIYEKVINHAFGANNVLVTSSPIATNIETICSIDNVWRSLSGNFTGGHEGYSSGIGDFYIDASFQTNVKSNNPDLDNATIVTTVWYTKTTDTAASPVAGVTVTDKAIGLSSSNSATTTDGTGKHPMFGDVYFNHGVTINDSRNAEIVTAGVYDITFNWAPSAAVTMDFYLWINELQISARSFAEGDRYESAQIVVMLELQAGDIISIRGTTSADAIYIRMGHIKILRVGS